MKINFRSLVLIILILIPYIAGAIIVLNKSYSVTKVENSNIVVIDKSAMKLHVFNYKGRLITEFPISLGANFGNKTTKNDSKTPQGIFRIMSIEDSREWTFDFEDDYEGEVKGAYGPWFIRLEVPGHRGIGIHGNLEKYPIGTRNSHGCIRMRNSDLENFARKININGIVIIVPSLDDLKEDSVFNSATVWELPELEYRLEIAVDDSIEAIHY